MSERGLWFLCLKTSFLSAIFLPRQKILWLVGVDDSRRLQIDEEKPFKLPAQKHALHGIAKTEDGEQKWNASMDTIHVYACAWVFGGKVSEISPPKAEAGEFSI